MGRTTSNTQPNTWAPQPVPVVYFPRSGDIPPDPVPYVLTAADVVRLGRLDLTETDRPDLAVERYRNLGAIRGTQIGKTVRYLLPDVLRFLSGLQGG